MKPTLVLVHGAFADSSNSSGVAERYHQQFAADLPEAEAAQETAAIILEAAGVEALAKT